MNLASSFCLRCSLRLLAKKPEKQAALLLLALPNSRRSLLAIARNFGSSSSSSSLPPSSPPAVGDASKPDSLLPSPPSQPMAIMTSDGREKSEPMVLRTKKPSLDPSLALVAPPEGKAISLMPAKRRRLSANPEERHTANVFLTPERAFNEYLLTEQDLDGLWNTKRRSPFANRPEIVVFLRVDVEKRAVDIWGSLAKLEQEKERRRRYDIHTSDMSLALLTAMRSYTVDGMPEQQDIRQLLQQAQKRQQEQRHGGSFDRNESIDLVPQDKAQRRQLKGSGRVVWAAIAVNAANFGMKVFAYMHTGSSAMFSESVHSLADTLNQAILAFGIWQSKRSPDQTHPYGWYNFSYVSSLISGVGIFFVGAGLSWYHGVHSLLHPGELESISWALAVLTGSFITESASLLVGVRQIRKEAIAAKLSFLEYVRRGYDPSVNVVLGEDCVAVFGVGVAGCCLLLSHVYSSHIPDAVGSLIIGTLLGGVASMIIYTNAVILVGQSIPAARRDLMRQELEADRVIRAVHDIKATEMGGRRVRFKAEVDIDGRELTRIYLDRIDIDALLSELQKASKSTEDLETFMLRQGEGIVDLMGAEIDRVERNLKKKYPEVRHVDLEVL